MAIHCESVAFSLTGMIIIIACCCLLCLLIWLYHVVYCFCFLRASILEAWRLRQICCACRPVKASWRCFRMQGTRENKGCAGSKRSLINLAKIAYYFLHFGVSSMHWGHANLLCIVPILSDARRRQMNRNNGIYSTILFWNTPFNAFGIHACKWEESPRGIVPLAKRSLHQSCITRAHTEFPTTSVNLRSHEPGNSPTIPAWLVQSTIWHECKLLVLLVS